MKLGLVSDTHGLFDPALTKLFSGVEAILHAGDIVGAHVLRELEAIAPVHAVLGNNDPPKMRGVPFERTDTFAGVRVSVLHDIGKPEKLKPDARRLLEKSGAQVLVSGHSHKPHALVLDGVLFVNPGSAGPRRFSLPRAAGLLEIARTRVTASVFSIVTGEELCRASIENESR